MADLPNKTHLNTQLLKSICITCGGGHDSRPVQTNAARNAGPSCSEEMTVVFLPPRWFLVCPRWQKGIPDLQESAECGQSPTTVWLLQQNWKTYRKSLKCSGCWSLIYLIMVLKKRYNKISLSFLLHCLSGWRSTRRLYSVRPGHWWCHAPGYLGPGEMSSPPSSLNTLKCRYMHCTL